VDLRDLDYNPGSRRSTMARKAYTREFRGSAVKMVLEQKRSVTEAAKNLGVLPTTLRYWLKVHRQEAAANEAPEEKALRRKVRELEAENQKLRIEREILKKAAAYFAKEHQP
jgi:transposase-like protein